MNSWIVAASSKDSGGGSSPSSVERNAKEVLRHAIYGLHGFLSEDLRPVFLGDFVSLTRSCSKPPCRCATVSYFSMRGHVV
jgi:hypothetical protein